MDGDVYRLDRRHAEALVDAAWAEQLARQESWPETTDVDRVARAFAALDAAGVTARAHFACCRSCGLSEIGAEAAPGQHGFVFFHAQSTEHAIAGFGLTLYYGVLRRDLYEREGPNRPPRMDDAAASAATLQVGREVAAALREAGLSVVWEENPDRAIKVDPIDWLYRLPEDVFE